MILEFAEQKIFPGPRVIILSGRASPSSMRRYLNVEEPKVMRLVRQLRKSQQEAVTPKILGWILQAGSLPQVLADEWFETATEWFDEKMTPAIIRALEAAGGSMARRINETRKQDFHFDATQTEVLKWMTAQGGNLIKELSADQAAAINALLHHQVFIGITSPYQLAQMLKPQIGLLRREALAVVRYRVELQAAGLAAEKIRGMTEKYAEFLHKARAERIARTELANAYEHGQWASVLQAQEAGFVDEVEKEWITAGDERVCDDCEAMDGETAGLEEPFSNGLMHPPAHPGDRCDVGYRIIRR